MTKYYGIGCFHFQPRNPEEFELTSPKEYCDALRKTLDQIDNLNNLGITEPISEKGGFFSSSDWEDDETTAPFSFDDATGYSPAFANGSIEFDLFLPKRKQEEVSPFGYATSVENFKVRIRYGSVFCFTIVEPVGTTDSEDASSSVAIVREFLEQALEKTPEGAFELSCLGPSPFHADFKASLVDDSEIAKESPRSHFGIASKAIHRRGYDQIEFYGSTKHFKKFEQFEEALWNDLGDEFGLYYLTILFRAHQMFSWGSISTLIRKARKGFGQPWWKPVMTKSFLGAKIEKLFMQVSAFKSNQILFERTYGEHMETIANEKGAVHLTHYLDEGLKETSSYYPIEETMDLVKFFDDKQSNYENNLYITLSAFAGAAIALVFQTWF